jgi:hypothetical protein
MEAWREIRRDQSFGALSDGDGASGFKIGSGLTDSLRLQPKAARQFMTQFATFCNNRH